jgi:hypothetical protein
VGFMMLQIRVDDYLTMCKRALAGQMRRLLISDERSSGLGSAGSHAPAAV